MESDMVDLIELLRDQYSRYGITSFKQAAKEIERLRDQRDELRREICGYSFEDARGVAKLRGWDCFKEER